MGKKAINGRFVRDTRAVVDSMAAALVECSPQVLSHVDLDLTILLIPRQAIAYATCVDANLSSLSTGACAREFEQLRTCYQAAVCSLLRKLFSNEELIPHRVIRSLRRNEDKNVKEGRQANSIK